MKGRLEGRELESRELRLASFRRSKLCRTVVV